MEMQVFDFSGGRYWDRTSGPCRVKESTVVRPELPTSTSVSWHGAPSRPAAAGNDSYGVVHLGVPIFNVLLVGVRRGQKWQVLGTRNSVGGDPGHAISPCLRESVMPVDEVVTAGSNLREDHRTRQVGSEDRLLMEPWTSAGVGNVYEGNEFGTESTRSHDVGLQSGDVELENPIGVDLITIRCLARAKARIEVEPHRYRIGAG